MCLGQFESSGVLIEVPVELVHAKGIDSLVGLVFDILQDEGFFKSFAYLFEGLFGVQDGWVGQLEGPSFGEGATSAFAHFVEKDQHNGGILCVDCAIHDKVGLHGQEPVCGVVILSREVLWESCFEFGWSGHQG